MNQTGTITTENIVFNHEQLGYNSSTTYSSNNEALIVVWMPSTLTTVNIDFNSIESKIENSADLLKKFDDDPAKCEEYILTRPRYVKIFFILSIKYVPFPLENIHDVQVIHSIYIHDEILNKEEFINKYSEVIINQRYFYSIISFLGCQHIQRF